MNKRQKKAATFAAVHGGWLPAIQYAGIRRKTRVQKFLIQTLIEDVGWMRTANLAVQARQEGDRKTSDLLFAGLRGKHKVMKEAARRIPHDPYKCPHSSHQERAPLGTRFSRVMVATTSADWNRA